VVDQVSAADPLEVRDLPEEAHRQAAVDEPVVDHDVREPEERHAGADADERRAEGARHELAADHDQRGGDRRVHGREHVVGLEPPPPLGVVRPVDAPEPRMPHATVEQSRPGLHGAGDRDRDHDGNEDVGHGDLL
jgi:hypothetical protein